MQITKIVFTAPCHLCQVTHRALKVRLFFVTMPLLLTLFCTTELPARAADFVVISNPQSGIDKLNREQVINIFLGRTRQLPSGLTILPIDLPNHELDKAEFYRLLVNKNLSEINSYWARLYFSGRIPPPASVNNSKNVIETVAKNPGAIGYVQKSLLNTSVKPVFELNAK